MNCATFKRYRSLLSRVPTSTIGGSFFEWDGGSPDRILTFMHLLGYHGLAPVAPKIRRDLVKTYATMPIWPTKGTVKEHDGMILVKMGPKPGVAHLHQ